MADQSKSFSGKCPTCQGYNTRIRTEVINYGPDAPIAAPDPHAVVSRTRIYLCNACTHIWSETVPGGEPGGAA